jgi:DNA polymerase II small subunit/DNA polymerase delta subunit B
MFNTIKDTAQMFDNCLLELGKKMNIVLLPGSKDPTDSFMPQQQLSRFLFYEASKNMLKPDTKSSAYQNDLDNKSEKKRLVLATNPVEITLDSHRFLLTSG